MQRGKSDRLTTPGAKPEAGSASGGRGLQRLGTIAVLSALFLACAVTVLRAWPRIAGHAPRMVGRFDRDWESLRRENHPFYARMASLIGEVQQQVPEHGVVVVRNLDLIDEQFLAYYLVPRRLFWFDADEVRLPKGLAQPIWVLSLGRSSDDRLTWTLRAMDRNEFEKHAP
jgi:hypothetical protein